MQMRDVETVWFDCCAHYPVGRGTIALEYAYLAKRYNSNSRHYHDLHHIHHLLHLAEQFEEHLKDKDIVTFSIFYHDIVYNVLRKDNEARSAVIAEKRLTRLKVPPEKITVISDFIKATQTHQIPGGAPFAGDLAWFLDFDMAILAEPWSRYEHYAREVRKEYRIYPDLLYNPGRKSFLQKTIAAGHVFHTDHFRTHHEAAALANMERELEWYR